MDTLFFIFSKVIWALIKPESWIMFGMALGILLLWRNRRRAALRVGAATLVVTLMLGTIPFGDLLLNTLEARYPPTPELPVISGIIVLGGAEEGMRHGLPHFNQAAERFTAALALAREHPGARVLFSGGSGRLRDAIGTSTPEAHVADAFFTRQGLDPDRLVTEAASRNTAENARNSYTLIEPKPGDIWVLVTSASHMPRAMQSFRRAGWPRLIAWPVDYRTQTFADGLGWNLTGKLDAIETALKEYVGQFVYDMRGI